MRGPAAQVLLWSCLLQAHAGAAPPRLFVPPEAEIPAWEPPPAGVEPEPAPLDARPRFYEGAEADDEILARLCKQPLRSIGPLGGGASISLKATLADGTLA